MTFIKLSYSIYLILIFLIVGSLYLYDYRKYRTWLKDCFNLRPKLNLKVSRVFFFMSVLLFGTSLLDLRGKHEQINTPLSDQKTIILIDASSSMLVEDVQPNRFKRALTVARHFVKNAVGHQISIILFSDISKRLIPFTDDIDLLDARLAGLEDERLRGGGSNITAALSETVQSLKLETSNGKPGGNILLITDAEENGDDFKIEDSKGISLALVGIGTVSGGKIPMRTKRGTFSGYKTHMNEEVISKLDEKFLDRIASSFQRSKKWVVLSFSMPTEEVLNFFREGTINTSGIDQTKIRPVLSQWLVIAGIMAYLVSIFFGNARSYTTLAVFIIAALSHQQLVLANVEAVKDKQANDLIVQSLDDDWTPEHKQRIALDLARKNELEKASLLYKEASGNLSLKAKANYGTTLLANGDPTGLKILDEVLRENSSKDVELERSVHTNIKKYLVSSGGGGGSGEDKNKEDKDSKDNKDKKSQSGDSGKDSKSESQDGNKDKKDKQNEQDKKNEKGGNDQQDKQITNMAQREREIDKKRKMMKVPALLKQLMQDDRALQSEYIDTETNDKNNSREKRDW